MAQSPFNDEEQAIIRNLDLVLRAENVLKGGLGFSLVEKWNRCVHIRAKMLGLRLIEDEDLDSNEWSHDNWEYYPINSSWHGFTTHDDWMPELSIEISDPGHFFGNMGECIRIVIGLKEFSKSMSPHRRIEVRELVRTLSLRPNDVNVGPVALQWVEEHGWEGQMIYRHDTSWDFILNIGTEPVVDATAILNKPTAIALRDSCPMLSAAMAEYAHYCRRFRDLKRKIYYWRDYG